MPFHQEKIDMWKEAQKITVWFNFLQTHCSGVRQIGTQPLVNTFWAVSFHMLCK